MIEKLLKRIEVIDYYLNNANAFISFDDISFIEYLYNEKKKLLKQLLNIRKSDKFHRI